MFGKYPLQLNKSFYLKPNKPFALPFGGVFYGANMAIQKINLGTAPTGAGGDTQRSANTKINTNFSNPDHAASRTIGFSENNIPTVGMLRKALMFASSEEGSDPQIINESVDFNDYDMPSYRYISSYASDSLNAPDNNSGLSMLYAEDLLAGRILQTIRGTKSIKHLVRLFNSHEWTDWHTYYGTWNTHEHGTNGYLKPSSPIIMLYKDKIEANPDAKKTNPEFVKNGVGDYTIKNTTGLRDNGWYIEIPNDLNGNPHVAVTIEDNNGEIRLKTYKRIFDMNTFKFGPDLDSPLDIPDGRWIDLRFNDLSNEVIDEPIE